MTTPEPEILNIAPQAGPQMAFLSTTADIAIFGGAAGGGKTFALLAEPLRHYSNHLFGGVLFRKNATQFRAEGGLWHESMKMYKPLGGWPREAFLDWQFPSGMRMKFAHLEHDNDVYNWQGSQIPYMGFDELTHFSKAQFFYMLSRNRSTSGVPGYIRATCNPDVDSWVREFIDWWIGPDGFPIPERSGALRYFIRINDEIIWADTAEEIKAKYGQDELPKSVTFIPSKVHDNKIMLAKDPSYLANLRALSYVERQRLLEGNWNIKASAGNMFRKDWFRVVDAIPAGWVSVLRFWDRAATKPNEVNKDPDWTRGLLIYKYPNNTYLVGDLRSLRDTPGQVEKMIINTAHFDSHSVMIMAQQDPGSAGVAEKENFIRMLSGFLVEMIPLTKDKLTRSKPVSAQCEAGNILVLRAPWNNEFFNELENFPDGSHDDIVDCLSGAFNRLSGAMSLADLC